jgi:CubicO group peptidase (beta-lactamase class C family)
MIVQRMIELVEGDFPDAVRRRVLEPLGMKESSYSPLVEKTIHGTDEKGTPLLWSWTFTPVPAAGGLWTTAEEYGKIFLALQGRPCPTTNSPLLVPKYLEQLKTGSKANPNYGLGMGFIGSSDARYFYHEGSLPGFRTCLCGNDQQGVVIFTNSDNGDALHKDLLQVIGKMYGWQNLSF